ncbi:deoxyribose-phosphate aldolase [Alkaliphilus hydrothermalis]|uniref:Deoxyribose-phosphate aldolase n=1 Tax=Alkaliphilus hydrothermalis TaxID=1482730 RepID=A0ABS2NMA4_9FIRM|nr:deoxyribose-phosphate aldolase [Alkaliphilus hydrothermalis]MBM7614050.1 deoxyribose-phosphate aldolase [Alkaliphilus hydrothermalis]
MNTNLAAYIDHTLLKPEASREQVVKLCEEAKEYKFASVCINPGHVREAAELLRGCEVKVCTVVGFPLGATTSEVKALETKQAIENGADEIDMVLNIGALKDGNEELVYNDVVAVVKAADGKLVKVILETGLLSDEEKVVACKLVKKAGADFVKTSTGFGPGGATAEDIKRMREAVGKEMGVKASGGVRDYETAMLMIDSGATRIGTSSGVIIMAGKKDDISTY